MGASLLLVNNVVDVSFQLSVKNILNFSSDDDIVPFRKVGLKNIMWISMPQVKLFSHIYSGLTCCVPLI